MIIEKNLPEGWNKSRLKEIFELRKGKKVNITDMPSKDSIPYIAIENLRGESISKFTNDDNGLMCNPSDLLLVWDGANCGTVGFGLNGFVGSTITRLRKIDDCINENYAFKFLKSKFKYFNTHTTGATIPHLEKNSVINLMIPIPPIDIQKKIVTVLEKAKQLKEWRKESDKLTDDYLNSVFLKMLKQNEKNNLKFSDFVVETIDYRGKTPPFSPEGVRCISAANVSNGKLKFDREKKVSKETYKRWTTRGFPESGNILVTTEAPVGEVALYPKNETFLLTRRVFALKLNQELVSNLYILYYMLSLHYKRQLRTKLRGSTVPRILKKDLLDINVPCVDINLQREFAKTVEEIVHTTKYQEQSKQHIDNLFNVLMQKAFRGELVC